MLVQFASNEEVVLDPRPQREHGVDASRFKGTCSTDEARYDSTSPAISKHCTVSVATGDDWNVDVGPRAVRRQFAANCWNACFNVLPASQVMGNVTSEEGQRNCAIREGV